MDQQKMEITGQEPIRWMTAGMKLQCYTCENDATYHLKFGNETIRGQIQVCAGCLKKFLSGENEL